MGVPAFFRWLSRKYPSIVVHCVEEKKKQDASGESVPVDISQKNPNDTEFDNLYLDMNGIIHPCCHPEDKPAPKNENEMMVLIFEYMDRLMAIVRPRKVLYMAIDGVAPRAKMNQQRSRRFRASQESVEKDITIGRIRSSLEQQGCYVPPVGEKGEKFDSNCITPGTPFMFRLADCLRYYVYDRLTNDPGWKDLKVILSDANVPGEGEHKIMDYIRHQRGQPDHDPNTHHCLCGADADLIMLGLATHEPYFTIIREEFKPNQPRPCEICNQMGHEAKECTGAPKEKKGKDDAAPPVIAAEQEFIFLRLNVLREYLEKDLIMDGLKFNYDFERALDDWVFMCFFVGNDFLPHLPSLSIREGAIDRLIRIYKDNMHRMGGYLADAGDVNMGRVQIILTALGEVEDEIFKKRRVDDLSFARRNKERQQRNNQWKTPTRPSFQLGGQFSPRPPSQGSTPVHNLRQTAKEAERSASVSDNQNAAAALRSMLMTDGDAAKTPVAGQKRKHEEATPKEDKETPDEVRLWEDGWKDRYYESKFGANTDEITFRQQVANEYAIGLCWVLRYYYQGCPSWKWYFPYHYAPFASDFAAMADLPNDFERNTAPFNPLEQLMGVFPAGSKSHVPAPWQELMTESDSAIIDFYPTNFKIDLNGKKYAWQGVALLPFVDETRLFSALKEYYPMLTEAEKKRNTKGGDRLFVSKSHPVFDFMESSLYEDGVPASGTAMVQLPTKLAQGVGGELKADEFYVKTGDVVESPLPQCDSILDNKAICVQYDNPSYPEGHVFSAKPIAAANPPARVLKPNDLAKDNRGNYRDNSGGNQGYRPQLGFQRGSGYRGGRSDSSTAKRFIGQALSSEHGGQYSNNYPPPGNYGNNRGPRDHQQGQNYGGRGGHHQRSGTYPHGSGNQGSLYGGYPGQQQGQSLYGGFPGQQGNVYGSYTTSQGGGGGGGRYGGQQGGGGGYNQQSNHQRSYSQQPQQYQGGYGGGGGQSQHDGGSDRNRQQQRGRGQGNGNFPAPPHYRR